MTENWTHWHTFSLLIILLGIALFAWRIPTEQIVLMWVLVMGAFFLFLMAAADGITGRFWLGWLINEQNRLSLSRFQMSLWTIVVLSAFLTAIVFNLRKGHVGTALDVAIPEEVWMAMGISTASFVGSPLILQEKRKKKTNVTELETYVPELKQALDGESKERRAEEIRRYAAGNLIRNLKPEDARLNELITGEEVGNVKVLDLSRLQNLFFTLIIVGMYAASLGLFLAGAADTGLISQFPAFSSSAAVLLGISHGGYLTNKAVDKQPEGEND